MHLFIPNKIRYNMLDDNAKAEEAEFKDKAFMLDEEEAIHDAINYDKLIAHIRKKHSRNVVGKKYDCCVYLGKFPNMFGSFSEELSEFSKTIEIGPSMFLMTLK